MEPRKVVQVFSEELASRLTGVSVRQLRYWDKDGFFSPSLCRYDGREAYGRLYSFRDIAALRVLDKLRNKAKVKLQHLREVKQALLLLGDSLWAETTLFVHNKRVIFENPQSGMVEEVVSGQRVMKIVLRAETENLEQAIKRLNKRRQSDIGKFEKNRSVASNQLVIAGTRIPVANVKAFASAGYSVDKIKAEYPTLTKRDIRAAINAKAA